MSAIIFIAYYDALVYSSLAGMTDISIDVRFKLEEKHDKTIRGMIRMDAKYEELSSGRHNRFVDTSHLPMTSASTCVLV